jgi:transglutaminase-like putative cysteine protease
MWPNQPFSKVLFTPAGTTAVRAPVARLSVDVHGIFEAEQLSPGAAYAVWKRESVPQLLVDRQRLTELPDDLDPRVRELAKRVVAGADTDREKIAAVEQYFLSNYRYEFGIEIPPGQDALTYFLLQRPPAHCEYFASGAAVLLRAAGVPCRYVTGFVTAESNRYGGYWVARNRDAHAWAEAFDRERGWVLVEATPAVGVPQQTSASPARQLWDALRAGWQRFAAAFRQDAGRAVADAAKWLLLRPATAVLVTVAVAVWLFRRFRRRHRRAAPIELDPLVVQLQALLRHMDRRWSQSGLKRSDHETLHQFAQRIESERAEPVCHRAAAWYRNFAAARYGRRLDEQTIHALREAQQQILGEALR